MLHSGSRGVGNQIGQYFIERRFGRGFSRAQQATMKERWLSFRHGQ